MPLARAKASRALAPTVRRGTDKSVWMILLGKFLKGCGGTFSKKFPHKTLKTVAKHFILMYNNNAKAKADSTVYETYFDLPI